MGSIILFVHKDIQGRLDKEQAVLCFAQLTGVDAERGTLCCILCGYEGVLCFAYRHWGRNSWCPTFHNIDWKGFTYYCWKLIYVLKQRVTSCWRLKMHSRHSGGGYVAYAQANSRLRPHQ